MSHIHVLPPDLRNKIAAGEVIERPASVVKELLENSIDAGSTDINVEILKSGKQLIRVSDNGSGMAQDDALLAFERHATSKLSSEEDLFNIHSLGFRGEALPAIASVSKVRITTGTNTETPCLSIAMHGGTVQDKREAPPQHGTTIEVKDLFFNTPARRKFLKTDSTEMFHIIDTVTKAAISNPHIRFTLKTGSQETLNLPSASDVRERLIQIYGGDFFEGLLEVDVSDADIVLKAFASKSENFRNSKANQFVFVNNRPVKDQSISHAVYRAYEGIMPSDKHPIFFVFVMIDPRRVDYNVHPTKREVRFQDKEAVYRFVLATLRDAVRRERRHYTDTFGEPLQEIREAGSIYSGPLSSPAYPENLPSGQARVSEPLSFGYKPSQPCLYVGDTFVAVSGKGGLTIIDYHAAHERILYEKLLKGMRTASKQLLFPLQVRLPAREYSLVLKHADVIRDFGIEIDEFGQDTVIVRSVPSELFDADISGILSDIAAGILEGPAAQLTLKEELAARVACHSSVRGRVILQQEEVSRLLKDLDLAESPDQCPHGRPTRIFYSLNDLNKLFKRK